MATHCVLQLLQKGNITSLSGSKALLILKESSLSNQ